MLAANDVRLEDLQDRIGTTVGQGYEAITSDQLAAESQAAVDVILYPGDRTRRFALQGWDGPQPRLVD